LTQSRNIFDVLSANLGKEAMQYNPPFVYCMGAYTTKAGSRQVVVGLGNGMLLRFKRKGLEIQEICGDSGHADQIAALHIDQARSLLVTGSHDKTMAMHRMAADGE
jgi:N-acyl-L-homoserine lactone synthetase